MKKRKVKDKRLVVGEFVCDFDEFLANTRTPAKTQIILKCPYCKPPYEKCVFREECDLQKEVMDYDADQFPDIIRYPDEETQERQI